MVDSGSLECQILKHFSMFIQLIFIHCHLPARIDLVTGDHSFVSPTGAQIVLWVSLEVWICLFSVFFPPNPKKSLGGGSTS